MEAEILPSNHKNDNRTLSSGTKDIISNNLEVFDNNTSDDDDGAAIKTSKKRVQLFTDSDSDTDEENVEHTNLKPDNFNVPLPPSESDDDGETGNLKTVQRSRIQRALDSDSENSSSEMMTKNEEQQSRMKNKRNKMRDKFKSLVSSRIKDNDNDSDEEIKGDSSKSGDGDLSSVENIKQMIKERITFTSSICDPDTSDEDSQDNVKKSTYKQKKERKSTKLTSPKPKMSAKQAMENMQKIKSESNRMLREQDVSLPYHRPKALTLKDIMNRRKPAVSSDGKALPIKMNEEQLRHYAQQLAERQKEVIELCKSDTEEEEIEEKVAENDYKTETETVSEVTPKLNDNNDTATETIEIVSKFNETNKEELLDNDQGLNKNEEQASDISMHLAYNDSANGSSMEIDIVQKDSIIEDDIISYDAYSNTKTMNVQNSGKKSEPCTEDSQMILLHFDSEKIEINKSTNCSEENNISTEISKEVNNDHNNLDTEFSDDDYENMEDIDSIIENADVINKFSQDHANTPMLIRDQPLNIKPKLTGAPGMVIDLDSNEPLRPKKQGVELLKERFIFYAKLEEMEKEKEKIIKPGRQHLKLKQELADQIAEQRSLEWAKRLEEEKQQHMEINALRGDMSDEECDIDKIEAKLEDSHVEASEADISESEEEEDVLEENDLGELKDKPRKSNPLVADEAEESDCDEYDNVNDDGQDDESTSIVDGQNDHEEVGNEDSDDDEESSEESSESEEELSSKTKKGRILKAFEDSDDEDGNDKLVKEKADECNKIHAITEIVDENQSSSQIMSQDVELTLAQRHKSGSDEVFTSLESALIASEFKRKKNYDADTSFNDDKDFGTQTFSILDSTSNKTVQEEIHSSDKLSVICETQPYNDDNLDAVAAMCSGSFSQNLVPSQFQDAGMSQSQPIGEDLLALCTGKFYDNQFVSQQEDNINKITQESEFEGFDETPEKSLNISDNTELKKNYDNIDKDNVGRETKEQDGNLLKSILDELNDPEFDEPKPNKYFCGNKNSLNNNKTNDSSLLKKKFVIDSDDEAEPDDTVTPKKIKKLKKKKAEKRALQISDDEESDLEDEEDDMMSEIENEEDVERIVEYDSEENEVEVKQHIPKKKRKVTDFFEQEAELTSEDEWIGSGDENEAGLDLMEREEGDDDKFHQGKLRRELGQIHMRDVLDQDKREVRLIQELLFEDGDLGDGHRQRKFRWKNTDGGDEATGLVDEFDTQEEEFESEEQWRKQRHEREIFLRQMQNKDEQNSSLNVSVNRTTIIKANLSSKTMSSLLLEVEASNKNEVEQSKKNSTANEKKTAKEIPSPKKPFTILQQNYHGSLLTRGRGALARLAALATPLVADDDAPKVGSLAPSSKRNFVFTALSQSEVQPKVSKRKADTNTDTPRLIKKMKTQDKQKHFKSSLLDHLKT